VKLFGLLLLLVPAAALAQIYKCLDERGVTHYTDKPRPGCKGGAVDIRSQPPVSGQIRPQSEDFARQDADFKRRQIERERVAEKDRAALQRRCGSARNEFAYLSSVQRLFRVGPNGERVYLDDSVREKRLAELREQLRACP